MNADEAIRRFERRMPGVTMRGTRELYEYAIEALREQVERNNGCRYCQDKSYKQKGYYVDDPEGEIVGINHYCMNCGKRLEVEP